LRNFVKINSEHYSLTIEAFNQNGKRKRAVDFMFFLKEKGPWRIDVCKSMLSTLDTEQKEICGEWLDHYNIKGILAEENQRELTNEEMHVMEKLLETLQKSFPISNPSTSSPKTKLSMVMDIIK